MYEQYIYILMDLYYIYNPFPRNIKYPPKKGPHHG